MQGTYTRSAEKNNFNPFLAIQLLDLDALPTAGALLTSTPGNVIKDCAITFAMLGGPDISESIAFQDDGVVGAISPGKRSISPCL